MPIVQFIAGMGIVWLPGWLGAKLLRSPLPLASGAILSGVLLFNAVFWLDAAHVPVTFASAGAVLGALSLGLAGLALRFPPGEADPPTPGYRLPPYLTALAGLFAVVFVGKFLLAPLLGGDMRYRWNYLAETLLRTDTLRFYPPLTAADFRFYVFPEAFAPFVSITYWWMYAAAGHAAAAYTVIPVAAQGLVIAAFAYRLAEAWGGLPAARWTTLLLMGSTLVWIQVESGVEGGWIAASMVATFYFLWISRAAAPPPAAPSGPDADRLLVLGGLAACVAALSREHGVTTGCLGVMFLAVERRPLRHHLLFAAPLLALAAPWYVRTWILTGNPIFSLNIAHLLPVNPVCQGFLTAFAEKLGLLHRGPGEIAKIFVWLVLYENPLVCVVGATALMSLGRSAYLFVASMVLLVLLWLKALGFTDGGWTHSIKVLTPVFVLLAICGGVYLARLCADAPRVRRALLLAGVLLACKTLLDLAATPYRPFNLRAGVLGSLHGEERRWRENFDRFERETAAANGTRTRPAIITANMDRCAQLRADGVPAISIYSPEIRFLYDLQPDPAQVLKRLDQLNVKFVEDPVNDLNRSYLRRFPFFAGMLPQWEQREITGARVYVVPAAGAAAPPATP